MPILGMNVPEKIIKATRDALHSELNPCSLGGFEGAMVRMFTKADRIEIHRTAYTGDYKIVGKNRDGFFPIAAFAMLPMPGNYGVCIFHHVKVEPSFRRMGVGTTLLQIRMRAARIAGYSLAMATVKQNNLVEKEILRKAGWNITTCFMNKRSSNAIDLWLVKL